MSVMVHVPAAVYVQDGFLAVDVPPSPKVHAQLVGEPDDVSVNWTNNCTSPEVGEKVKLAIGGGAAEETAIDISYQDPPSTVSLTV
jgi:hypothetical protein